MLVFLTYYTTMFPFFALNFFQRVFLLKTIASEFQIRNELGLHARPASLFVQTASSFGSEIVVEKDGDIVNGKSLMGLLMLAAGYGSTIKIKIKGEDAEEMLKALIELFERNFDEE